MRQGGGELDCAALTVDGGGLNGGDLVPPERLANDLQSARQRCIPEAPPRWPRSAGSLARSDFSELASSVCALASAEARRIAGGRLWRGSLRADRRSRLDFSSHL
jgi:hypothetical protein